MTTMYRSLVRSLARLHAVALLTAGLLAPCAHAQFTPTAAGPFDYNTTSNWTASTINGVFSQTPSVAQFVTFSVDTTLTTGFTFGLGGSSKSLTLRGDGTDRTVTLGGDVSVSGTTSSIVLGSTTAGNKLNVVLGADRTFTVASGNTLTVNNVISGGHALTKAGTGQLTLAGANTYTGTTTVNAGTLFLNASGTLASGSNVVVNSTTAATTAAVTLGAGFTQTIGTLNFSGSGGAASNNNVTLNTGSTLTLGGTVTYDGTNNPLATTIAGPGTLALGGNRTFDIGNSSANPDFFITAPISGTGFTLTKTGAGRMDLQGINSYTGGTIVNGGTLFLNAASPLLAASPVTVSATGGGTATYVLNAINQSVGALTLGGADSTSTSVNNVTVNPSGTLTLSDTVTYLATNNPLGSTIGPSGSGPGTVALGGNRTFAIADSTSTINELIISIPVSGSGQSLIKTGAGRLYLSGANTYDGGTVINGGNVFLGASDTLVSTGAVTVNNTAGATATLVLGTNVTQTIGALTFGGAGGTASSINNVSLNTGAVLTLGGTVTFDATGNPAASTVSTISGGTLALGGNRTFAVADSTGSSNELAISSVISGAGQSITKTGAGRLYFLGANTYDGGTVLNGGQIFLGANDTLVSTGAVTVNNTVGATSNFILSTNVTQTIGALTFGGAGASTSSTNNVTLNTGSTLTLGGTVTYDGTNNPLATTIAGPGTLALGGNRTFDIGNSSANPDFFITAPISGTGFTLTKTGAGRMDLQGINSYTGGTIVNGGTLFLSAASPLLATSPVTVSATGGGTATYALSAINQSVGALTLGGADSTSTSVNNVTVNPSGTLTLSDTVTYLATNNPLGSTIGPSGSGPGTVALGGNRTFAIADSTSTTNELTISIPVSGSGQSLIKTGAGTLRLSATNTYDGGTILNAGSILLNATDTLAASGAVTINNTAGATSTLTLDAGFTQAIGALTFGGTGATTGSTNNVTLNTGATLTLGGTVTYLATGNPAAATIAGPGTLAIGTARTFDIGDSSSSVNEILISAPVSGGSITKIGAGNLNLSGANTYTGGTTVSTGGLVVRNTTGSGVGTGAVTIQNGAHLRGSGFVGGFTTIQAGASLGTGGTGATPGNLTFTNGLTLNDGAIFNFTLGTESDKFTLTGGTLTGASTLGSLTINLTAGTGFGAGTYTLFDFSTGGVATNSFTATDFSLGTTISGYSYALATSGNMLQLTASAIPEPSTYAAIFGALSLVGAAVWRRRVRA